MLDYMRALQKRFTASQRYDDEKAEIEGARRALSERLDREGRKRLLRLVDLEDALRSEEALDSFIAGFKLALGIAQELRETGLYSYDAGEQARSMMALVKRAREETE